MTSRAKTPARETFRRFDAAEYLVSEAEITAFLNAAVEGADASHFARALGTVARARNLSALARQTGLTRQGLHKALSADGHPSLETTMSVLSALGLEISVRIRKAPATKTPVRKRKAA